MKTGLALYEDGSLGNSLLQIFVYINPISYLNIGIDMELNSKLMNHNQCWEKIKHNMVALEELQI